MNRLKYIPALTQALKTAKPEIRIYEDYNDGKIEFPCVILSAESEQVQDWSDDHSVINLEVEVIVKKENENPSLPNEINDLICSDAINQTIENPIVHYVTIGDNELERKDHTTTYRTNLEVAVFNNANS